MSNVSTPTLGCGLKIVRRGKSARSRQHQGVLSETIYECAALEVRRTEMETAGFSDSLEFGDFSAVHFVISGNPLFRTAQQSANLMPGDSVIFTDNEHYTILNNAPPRSVILSVLFKGFSNETRS
jgi:hypothetical protein